MYLPIRRTKSAIVAFACVAISACGGGSNYSPPPPPPVDTTAPTVADVQVPAGLSVNRSVTLAVSATDGGGIAEVRFFVDGVLLGSDTSAPFSIDWDTSGVADGDHTVAAEATDAAGNVGRSGDTTVTVRNTVQYTVTLTGEQEVPAVDSAAAAQADLAVNLVSGDISGTLTVSGIVPTAAHIHDAFAGLTGGVLVPLDQDAGDPGSFTLPSGSALDAAGIERLLAGALYVNVHTAENPGGELRGQILPEGFVLRFAELSGDQEVPQVSTVASGRAAMTLDQATGSVVVQARVSGLDDAVAAHVHEAYAGANGSVLVPLSQDGTDAARWFVEDGRLNTAGLEAFAAGRLYVNVHSPANPGGEIRGQILPDGIAVLRTGLSGDQEVPRVDTAASGFAAMTLDESGLLMSLHVNTSGLPTATASHLHNAYGGANGGVTIGLNQDGSDPSHFFVEEQALTADQLAAIQAGATYVNVHTPANPGGEIRGQVIPNGILFAFGFLNGSQVVPPVSTVAGGTLAVTVDPAASTLVAHVNATGTDDATAAHLHDGYAGIGGGVSIGLTQDATDVTRWSATGVALTANQLEAFSAGRYYVNVHTPANPGGEIRGQVAPPPVEVLFTELSGDQEVPAVTSAASALAASTVNRSTGTVTLHLRTGGADDALASHIHGGYAGQNGGVVIGLTQDAGDVAHWSVTAAQLDGAGLADYLAGRLYVNLHTPANPAGEIRGQIAPQDVQVVWTPMDGGQVVPPVSTAASGAVATTVDLRARSLVAFANGSGVDDATSASVNEGAAGANGDVVLPLQQTPAIVGQWSGMTEPLDAASFSAYRAGRLHAQIATPAHPGGEIRGQILPPDAADFDDVPPTVTLASPGSPLSGTVTLSADASDNQGVTEVRFFADGVLIAGDTTAPYSVDWDTSLVADGDVTLSADAQDAAGNVGLSADVSVTVQNGTAVTLSQIQAQVFTPVCSACHSGPTSNILPTGMNLSSASASYDALVNVPSLQRSAIDRVEPGNPDNSYLIQKLEGTPGIGGVRMPQGGPYLDQPTVDLIRGWITAGAPNN